MPQSYCHHVNAAGVYCKGIPVKKRDYCYWHLHENGRRMKAARARARSDPFIIQLPVLDDLHAVQLGVMQLAEAINHGEIDDRSGRLFLAVLRLAASNLKAQRMWKQEGTYDEALAGHVEENAGFEEQYDLPEDFGLRVDPEVAFPPPINRSGSLPLNPEDGLSGIPENDALRAKIGQILHDAATLAPGPILQTTADDMEMMDVYWREGEEARVKRGAELERNRKRRERREERRRYQEMARNRNLQVAAEKLLREQQRKAEAAKAPPTNTPPSHQEIELNRKPPQPEGDRLEAHAVGERGA